MQAAQCVAYKWAHMLQDSSMRPAVELTRTMLLQCLEKAQKVRDIKGSAREGVLQTG